MDLRNTKIDVPKDLRIKVQIALFKLGVKWSIAGNRIIERSRRYYFIDDNLKLQHSDRREAFDRDDKEQIYPNYIIDMAQDLTITKERVLRAAEKSCETGREILQELFPEVFEEERYIDLSGFSPSIRLRDLPLRLEIRKAGLYKNRSFYLDYRFDWKLTKDDCGIMCLIPLEKTTCYNE